MTETNICTFNINNLFGEWVNKIDLDEAPARKAKNIKVLFRGVINDNPNNAIVVIPAEKVVIAKHIQEIFNNFER